MRLIIIFNLLITLLLVVEQKTAWIPMLMISFYLSIHWLIHQLNYSNSSE